MRIRRPVGTLLAQHLVNERGLSVIVFAIALPVIISLLVLTVGTGFLLVNKSRLTDIAEMAAFSALKTYQISAWPGHDQRALEALDAANAVLKKNPLNTESGTLEEIALGTTNGQGLEFGYVYRGPPPGGNPPALCGGSYPCFEPHDPANPREVNGARIALEAAKGSRVRIPFLNRLVKVRARLVATTSGSATIVIVDTSPSMTADSHLGASTTNPPARAIYPASVLTACGAPANLLEQSYCALPADRSQATSFTPGQHFKDDYRQVGNILIDTFGQFGSTRYVGPEPLSTALALANVALRKTGSTAFPGDTWRLIVARGQSPLQIPAAGQPGLATPDYLLQLTHFDNRGLYNADGTLLTPYPHPVHPNALDKDVLPDPTVLQENTPLVDAIQQALVEFNGIQTAPKKNLILITDGIGTCTGGGGCNDSFAGYEAAETALLALVPSLVAAGIDLTVVPVGGAIQPHLLNIQNPINQNTNSGAINYLSPEVAADLGYNGIGGGNLLFTGSAVTDPTFQSWCIDPANGCTGGCDQACADRYAYQNLGKPGVFFRRPMAVLGHIALQMSRAELGRLCLIQPTDPTPSRYIDEDGDPLTPEVLDPQYRSTNQPQTISTIAGIRSEQLAACLDRAPRSFGMEVVLRE